MKEKTGLLIFAFLFLLGSIVGISEANPGTMQLSFVASSLILISLVFRWFRQDTIRRGHQNLLDRGMFLLTAGHIVLPLYILWTRRFKGFLIIVLALLSIGIPSAIFNIICR
jgi:hypothetical protein